MDNGPWSMDSGQWTHGSTFFVPPIHNVVVVVIDLFHVVDVDTPQPDDQTVVH